MSTMTLISVPLAQEKDVFVARKVARHSAELLGFDTQDRTRIATAVSEIARNATMYGGGGWLRLAIEAKREARLVITVRDQGPGIADIDAILEGRHKSRTGLGVGILGARRLMESFTIDSDPAKGTVVMFSKRLPPGARDLSRERLNKIGEIVAARSEPDLFAEMRVQNQELLESLAALQAKQDESQRLNAELEDTNRGVVALYAELDGKAAELTALNASLEERIAAAVAEVQSANDALRQSQKMEAVGQLTGGIAHDFNNMLTGVIGGLDIIKRRLASGRHDDLDRFMDAASASANRAAALSTRLLAFSRRQSLDAKPLDVNALILSLGELLNRTIPEKIALRIRPGDHGMLALADSNQLENAILNLAINARDAMPDGGQLVIETRLDDLDQAGVAAVGELSAGRYIVVSVSDTGVGMPPELLEKIFDPFFTTKPAGQGTGLGLPMVHGFVRQSGGEVCIRSRLGEGTLVELYLPVSGGDLEAVMQSDVEEPSRRGNGQTVLVVEDNASVLQIVREVLAELSYETIEASNADIAVPILASKRPIHLLVSDVGLPGMTGRQLAEVARTHRPDIPILFITGYAESAAIRADLLGPNMAMIEKPFSLDALGAKIDGMIAFQAGPQTARGD